MNFVKYFMGFLLLLISIFLINRVISDYNSIDLFYNIAFMSFLFIVAKNIKMRKIFIFLFVVLLALGRVIVSSEVQYEPIVSNSNYTKIEKLSDIKKGEKTFIKFSADWCIYCKDLDKNVYSSEGVKELMEGYRKLTVDLTNTTEQKEKIKNNFGIVAPPGIVIIDEKNNVIFKHNGIISEEKLKNILKK